MNHWPLTDRFRFIVDSIESIKIAEDLCTRPELCLTIHLSRDSSLVIYISIVMRLEKKHFCFKYSPKIERNLEGDTKKII